MKKETLFEAIGNADEELLERCETPVRKKNGLKFTTWTAAAASICLIVSGIAFAIRIGGWRTGSSGSFPEHETGSSDFMSYAGPMLPMTLAEENDVLTADRSLTLDFSGFGEQEQTYRDLLVTDAYTLTNHSGQDETVTLRYPFVSSYSHLTSDAPVLTVSGNELSTPGLFVPGLTLSPTESGSYEKYHALLDGSEDMGHGALTADIAALEQTVTVYEFTDSSAPLEEYPAATISYSFHAGEGSRILSYRMNGFAWDKSTGSYRYDYFVKENNPKRILIVIGDDIADASLLGYEDGACEAGLTDVSATVTRREVSLRELLCELLTAEWTEQLTADSTVTTHEASLNRISTDTVTLDMLYASMVSLLVQHGYFSETMDVDYSDGRLDDVFDELFFQKQIFYLSCNVTVPAESSFTVSASFIKEASFDYACGGHEDTQIYGYDTAFSLGSCLSFRVQNATIMGADKIELVEQNFGFDPGQGIKTVELDLSTDRYYLTVRPAS